MDTRPLPSGEWDRPFGLFERRWLVSSISLSTELTY